MMYAVNFAAGEYDGYYEILLFVTADEQLAKNFVDNANNEYERAKNVARPETSIRELRQAQKDKVVNTYSQLVDLRLGAYKAQLEEIMKTDPARICVYGLDKNGFYSFETVEVR